MRYISLPIGLLIGLIILLGLAGCGGRYTYEFRAESEYGRVIVPFSTDEYLGLDKVGDKMSAEVELIRIRE